MNKLIVLVASITLSTFGFAENMYKETKSGNSMDSNISSMHNNMEKKLTQADILGDEDMQRLHKEMTLSGMSENGMEARRIMIGSEEGRAYHRALKLKLKLK